MTAADVEPVCVLLDRAAEVLAREHAPEEREQARRWLREAAMLMRVLASQP